MPAWLVKLIIAVVVAATVGSLYYAFRDELSLRRLVEHEKAIRQFQANHPVLIYVCGFLLYALVTGLSLPLAGVLSLLYGKFYGFWGALLLVSFGSTTGATIAFLFSRYLLRDTLEAKFGDRIAGFNRALEREGAFYLFTLRLIAAVPFWLINVVMGLTPIRVWTFWWVSQIGMLPGTMVYVFAGSQLPSFEEILEQGAGGILTPGLIIAFALLGIFPLAVKKIMERWKPEAVERIKEEEQESAPQADS